MSTSVVIFFAVVAVFLVSSIMLMTATAADLRKAATARRLKSLRAGTLAQTVEVTEDAPKRRSKAAAGAFPQFVPITLRQRLSRIYSARGHTVDMRILPLVAILGCAVAFALSGVLMHLSAPLVALSVLAGGALVPWQYLRMAKARHSAKFLKLFPDAIDLIVRAIRAGLPISAAIDMAGKEVADPVGAEFRSLIADIRVGNTFQEALSRATDRIQLVEFSFFSASLSLQNDTGGNLSDTLEILGKVLRRREEMRLKIGAMTSEARTSAYVMGSLPIAVGGLLFLIQPSYMAVYFTDPRAHYVLGLALTSMLIGAMIMRFMIKRITG